LFVPSDFFNLFLIAQNVSGAHGGIWVAPTPLKKTRAKALALALALALTPVSEYFAVLPSANEY
jgi:hypothetical protein